MAVYSERVQSLLDSMTLEEKVYLLAGASIWHTVPVERLGIPAIKVTDGPNGARGDSLFGSGTSAACMPVGIALASTWNVDLIEKIGELLGEEAQTKGARVLLAPTINIHRSTLNGRNFECYSEDPYLAGRMAVAYIKGVQSRNVGVSVKHFAGNNSEFERNTISSEIGERALREIYLPAFEAAVKEGEAWTVMAAYNKVNGTFASEHPELLTSILKDEWGFDGVVISDWFATHSVGPAVNAGLDLEMPGPTQWRGEKLVKAVEADEASEAAITDAAGRMLHLIERVGALEDPTIPDEQAVNRPEHRALARQAAAEGVVLLKNNDGLLPLDPSTLRSVAVIGPNAKTAQIMGGGSARVNAHYAITPFDGITAQLGTDAEVHYSLGCTNSRYAPLMPLKQVAPGEGQEGSRLGVAYFNNLDVAGDPALETTLDTTEKVWLGEIGLGVDAQSFSARITGIFTPEESGPHILSLMSSGLSRMYIDGKEVIENWNTHTRGDSFFGGGSTEKTTEIDLEAGKPLHLTIEYSKQSTGVLSGIRLGVMPVMPADAIERAAAIASQADVVLVFVGTTSEWESEGADKPNMDLPGKQDELVRAVAAANPRTVVVLQTGSPVTMPWLGEVTAVMQAWFPGQECGNGIADVLFGATDAQGRLPQTSPVRLQDNPAYINYPGENGKVVYGEGIFVGYRYYDKKEVEPLFPFGFGLSYTDFDYSNLRLSSDSILPDDSLEVSLDVTNTGTRSGTEVVQLYIDDPQASVARPPKELKGFAKISMGPRETRTVTLTIDRRALAYWDDASRRWMAEAGEFTVMLGRSSRDIRLTASFTLSETARFDGPGRPASRLTLMSTIKELLSDDHAKELLDRHIPGFSSNPQLGFAQGFSLMQLAGFDPKTFNEDVLNSIEAELAN